MLKLLLSKVKKLVWLQPQQCSWGRSKSDEVRPVHLGVLGARFAQQLQLWVAAHTARGQQRLACLQEVLGGLQEVQRPQA